MFAQKGKLSGAGYVLNGHDLLGMPAILEITGYFTLQKIIAWRKVFFWGEARACREKFLFPRACMVDSGFNL
ncbi:MAG: hypothetical protein PHH11_12965 [Methylomonas sp.]|nr:hypothetical protein [Methylomonas sp.]